MGFFFIFGNQNMFTALINVRGNTKRLSKLRNMKIGLAGQRYYHRARG